MPSALRSGLKCLEGLSWSERYPQVRFYVALPFIASGQRQYSTYYDTGVPAGSYGNSIEVICKVPENVSGIRRIAYTRPACEPIGIGYSVWVADAARSMGVGFEAGLG